MSLSRKIQRIQVSQPHPHPWEGDGANNPRNHFQTLKGGAASSQHRFMKGRARLTNQIAFCKCIAWWMKEELLMTTTFTLARLLTVSQITIINKLTDQINGQRD